MAIAGLRVTTQCLGAVLKSYPKSAHLANGLTKTRPLSAMIVPRECGPIRLGLVLSRSARSVSREATATKRD